MSPRNRKGMTIIDVVVVLLLLLVMAAVFLPATRFSGEGARRSVCNNNLKQIGIALHNYEENHKTFPPGWIAVRGPSSGEQERSAYGWATYVLPFLDHAPLFKKIDFKADDPSFQAEAQRPPVQFAQTVLPAFRCPSDLGEYRDETSSIAKMGTSNYVGNFGVGLPLLEHESGMMQGVFGCNSSTRIRDFRDGTTNVVLAGERQMHRDGSTWLAGRIDGSFNSYWAGIPSGTDPLAIVATVTDGDITEPDSDKAMLNHRGNLNGFNAVPKQVRSLLINRSSNGEPLNPQGIFSKNKNLSGSFSSYHTGGSQVLLGDASVRFISDSIDPNTLINLMRRNDGQSLGEY